MQIHFKHFKYWHLHLKTLNEKYLHLQNVSNTFQIN